MIPERRLGHMAKAVGVEISSGSGNDPRTLQRLPAEHPAIERGQQLALRKIASATKDHKIERIDRNDSRNHDQSTSNRFLLIHESPLTDALFLLVSKSDEVTTT